MVEKDEILRAIQETAAANGGQALGRERFERETEIRFAEWYGVHWATWNDAVIEAGFAPNTFNQGYDTEQLIELFVSILRQEGGWPPEGKLRLICRNSCDLPNGKTFRARLGNKADMAATIIGHCRDREGYDDIVAICQPFAANDKETREVETERSDFGFVYLMKTGKFHKVGRSNSVGRREYEIGTKLPEELTTVHSIKTDDPVGVEAYWHSRFADKRAEGEWFRLDATDIQAFKRWRRIY